MKKFSIVVIIILSILLIIVSRPGLEKQPRHSIVFYTGGGTNLKTIEVLNNTKGYEPQSPTRFASKFAGWFDEEGNEFIFEERTITKSITLYAHWENTLLSINYEIGNAYWPSGVFEQYVQTFDYNQGMVFIKKSSTSLYPVANDSKDGRFIAWRAIPQNEYNKLTDEEKEQYPEIIDFDSKNEEIAKLFEDNVLTLYAYYRNLR